jgi:hypothetical protein
MASQLVNYALEHRKTSHIHTFFTLSDIKNITSIKLGHARPTGLLRGGGGGGRQQVQPGSRRPVLPGSRRQMQRVGGPPKDISTKVVDQFKVDYDISGEPILLRSVSRQDGNRWCRVIAVEDLAALFDEHNGNSQGFTNYKNLYNHVRGWGGRASCAVPPILNPPTWSVPPGQPPPPPSWRTMPRPTWHPFLMVGHASSTAWRASTERV